MVMILMKTQRTVMLMPRMRRLVATTKARTTATRGQRNQRTRRRKGSDSVGFFYFSLHVIITNGSGFGESEGLQDKHNQLTDECVC